LTEGFCKIFFPSTSQSSQGAVEMLGKNGEQLWGILQKPLATYAALV